MKRICLLLAICCILFAFPVLAHEDIQVLETYREDSLDSKEDINCY